MRFEKTTARQVADYVVWSAHDSGPFISNLKLQKLLYYVQAWRLAVFDDPLSPEKFQAWVHGQVIPEVHRRFSRHQWRHIDEEISRPDLDSEAVAFVEAVLEEYGPPDARRLEFLTHREAPWMEARGGLSMDEPCVAEISEATMRTYYRSRLSDDEVASIREEVEAAVAPALDG